MEGFDCEHHEIGKVNFTSFLEGLLIGCVAVYAEVGERERGELFGFALQHGGGLFEIFGDLNKVVDG